MGISKGAIDPETGRLTISMPASAIDADLTREGLDVSPLGERCERVLRNPPWETTGFRVRLGEERFAGVICFKEGKMVHFTLMTQRPEFGTSWSDFSQEKEKARQAFHNKWLREQLPGIEPEHLAFDSMPTWEWAFGWGRIISGWDPKNGTTEIAVIYGSKNRDGEEF